MYLHNEVSACTILNRLQLLKTCRHNVRVLCNAVMLVHVVERKLGELRSSVKAHLVAVTGCSENEALQLLLQRHQNCSSAWVIVVTCDLAYSFECMQWGIWPDRTTSLVLD